MRKKVNLHNKTSQATPIITSTEGLWLSTKYPSLAAPSLKSHTSVCLRVFLVVYCYVYVCVYVLMFIYACLFSCVLLRVCVCLCFDVYICVFV